MDISKAYIPSRTARFASSATKKASLRAYLSTAITNVSKNILTTDGDVEGCVFNGSVAAIFAKKNLANTSSRMSGTISFTTAGNSSMQYYVDGLADGTWQIKVGGTVVGTAKSSNGLLNFTAPAGNVVLTKTA